MSGRQLESRCGQCSLTFLHFRHAMSPFSRFPFRLPTPALFVFFYPSSPATQDIAFGRRRSMDSSTLQQAIGVLTTGKRSTRDDCPGHMNWKEGVKPGKSNIRSYLFTPASATSAFAGSGTTQQAIPQSTSGLFLKLSCFNFTSPHVT